MGQTQPIPMHRWVEIHLPSALCCGVGLLGILLPLWFDPWAALPFEPAKAGLLRGAVGPLLLTGLLGLAVSERLRRAIWIRLRYNRSILLVVFVYAAVHALSALRSFSPQLSFWGASDRHGVATLYSQIALFLLLVAAARNIADRETLLRWLLLGSVPVSLYGLIQAAGWDPLSWQSDSVSPVLSTLGRSNFLGAYLALLFPFSLAAAQTRRRGWLLFGLHSLCLLFTLARAAWLAAAAGLLIFLWLTANPEANPALRVRYRTMVLVAVGAALAALFFLGEWVGRNQWSVGSAPLVGTDVDNTTSLRPAFGELREESLTRRWIIWQRTISLIHERPLLGHGAETFATLFNELYPPGSLYAGQDALVSDPHNQLLAELFATGLLGAAARLLLLGLLAWKLIAQMRQGDDRHRRLTAACLGALAAYTVQAQFNPDVVTLSTLFWMIAGAGLADTSMQAEAAVL